MLENHQPPVDRFAENLEPEAHESFFANNLNNTADESAEGPARVNRPFFAQFWHLIGFVIEGAIVLLDVVANRGPIQVARNSRSYLSGDR